MHTEVISVRWIFNENAWIMEIVTGQLDLRIEVDNLFYLLS